MNLLLLIIVDWVGPGTLLSTTDSDSMTSRSVPSRHKAQQEEEDAAALKLGPGTSEIAFTSPRHGLTGIILSEFNNAGCLLISEVKYLLENRDKDAPDTVSVWQPSPSKPPAQYVCLLSECTTKLWNMSRLLPSSIPPTRRRLFESRAFSFTEVGGGTLCSPRLDCAHTPAS